MTDNFNYIDKVFKRQSNKALVFCPPNQVFINESFDFLITPGGHLVEKDDQYKLLMKLLAELGEKEYYVIENLGGTLTERITPFFAVIPVESELADFDKIIQSFDPPFGFITNHFFVCGQNSDWGIYISELPTINIIGCKTSLTDKFREVFSIQENGFLGAKDFIEKEFKSQQFVNDFVRIYKLNFA